MWLKNKVFAFSFLIVVSLIGFGIWSPGAFGRTASFIHAAILSNFSWAYQIAPFSFLVFSIILAFSKYGKIKLGKDHEKPQYSYFGWFSMLFAAGMGIGLIFWGVAEPLNHFSHPPDFIRQQSGEAAGFAMRHCFFHWGLHPWAVYVVMSLCIAYFCFRRDMPPLISSCFYPLLGEKIYGIAGYCIDILAVFAVVFGIATSLGLGTMQISSGLAEVLPFIPDTTLTWLLIIVVVTILFMISTVVGLDRGIQVLSKANLILAGLLLLFMLLVGPTAYIFNVLTSTTGDYLSSLLYMSLTTHPFEGYEWTKKWTLFYWASWIAWSPFVGLFVASISRGRTIREFVLGALLVPSVLTFIWFAVFGGAAFHLQLEQGTDIAKASVGNISTALFHLIEHYPFAGVLTVAAVMALAVFFITSADSATLVLAMLTSNGDLRPSVSRKVVWGTIQSSVAAIVLLSGGLAALRKVAISSALPFTIIMFFLCRSLWRGLRYEYEHELSKGEKQSPP